MVVKRPWLSRGERAQEGVAGAASCAKYRRSVRRYAQKVSAQTALVEAWLGYRILGAPRGRVLCT